ncbi:hypothetical protein CVT25_006559 [Psilocybe cyanescens]|uniref:non-specific serine/threonine protein kinase n=1 Tax=Psilocybe cyanescens TaxID=93625 RepID=A0A409X469_PSICY|nr:hypothetical protein CVT25_006559 [Psilocybe cyanescens]
MSPELMQKGTYDSKSDIWSLGCLIYALCVLKPPFHKAKTHSELSIFIWLATVKAYRAAVFGKERQVSGASTTSHLVTQLRKQLQPSSSQTQQQQPQYPWQDVEHMVKQAVTQREELHVKVEIDQACVPQEEAVRKEVELQVQSVVDREAALRAEEQRLENMKRVVEVGMRKVEAGLAKGREENNPLKDVKNHHEHPSNHTNTNTSNSGTTTQTNDSHTTTTANPALRTPTALVSCLPPLTGPGGGTTYKDPQGVDLDVRVVCSCAVEQVPAIDSVVIRFIVGALVHR